MRNFYTVVCLTLCVFVIVTIVEEFYKGTRIRMKTKGENFLAAAVNLTLKNKRRYGGYIVHLSIVLMFVGFAGNAFNREATQRLATGAGNEHRRLFIEDDRISRKGKRRITSTARPFCRCSKTASWSAP